jgi:polyribonucleotide nucleotidyltransferase
MKWKFNRELVTVEVVDEDDEEDEDDIDTSTPATEKESVLCYNIDKYWNGINLRRRRRRRKKKTTRGRSNKAQKQPEQMLETFRVTLLGVDRMRLCIIKA